MSVKVLLLLTNKWCLNAKIIRIHFLVFFCSCNNEKKNKLPHTNSICNKNLQLHCGYNYITGTSHKTVSQVERLLQYVEQGRRHDTKKKKKKNQFLKVLEIPSGKNPFVYYL